MCIGSVADIYVKYSAHFDWGLGFNCARQGSRDYHWHELNFLLIKQENNSRFNYSWLDFRDDRAGLSEQIHTYFTLRLAADQTNQCVKPDTLSEW